MVHRLVLLAFVGPCPEEQEALHWNDVADDNWLENLRWGTSSENHADAARNGRIKFGDEHPCAKTTPEQREAVLALTGSMSHRKIARRLGMAYATVGRIIRGTDRVRSLKGAAP